MRSDGSERAKKGLMTDLGLGIHIGTSANMTQISQYRWLINQPYNAQWLGRYWCQPVVNQLAGTITPVLMKSNVFTLLAPSAYSSQQICTEVQTMTNITCANPFFAQQQSILCSTSIACGLLICWWDRIQFEWLLYCANAGHSCDVHITII